MTVAEPHVRANPRDELLRVALDLFANNGFAATSLQHIADRAGYSKSSVLYHFSSKEAVLDAALQPACDALDRLVPELEQMARGRHDTTAQIEAFVDFLLTYRLQAAVLLIQGPSLDDIPVIRASNAVVRRLSEAICSSSTSLTEQIRVGVGLAGAAFVLVASELLIRQELTHPDEDVRAALVGVLTDVFRTER